MLESDNLESQLEIVMTLFAHLGGMRWAGSESGMVCPAIFSWKCVKIEKDQSICFEQSQAHNKKMQKRQGKCTITKSTNSDCYLYKMLRKGKLLVVQQPVSVSVCKPEQSKDGNLIWRILSHCSFIWQFRFCKRSIVSAIYEFISMQSSHLQIFPKMLLVSLDLSNSSLATLPRHLLFQINLRYESSIFILPPFLGISVT